MPNFLIKFYRWLFSKEKTRYIFPIDEEIIKRDRIIQELVKKLQSQEAQLSNISAEKNKEKLELKKIDDDKKKVKEIIKQADEIEAKKYNDLFSFGRFYKSYFDLLKKKKFKGIDLTDKDDSVVFAKFGDFRLINGGNLAVIDDQGFIHSSGKRLNEIIYKPESLRNQIKRLRISLPCDKNHNFYPDLEEYEVPECIYNEQTGKIKWAKINKKPLKQLIIDREKIINESNNYIERLEKTKTEIIRKNKDLKMRNSILISNKEATDTELEKAIALQEQYFIKFGQMKKQIVNLTQSKEILEQLRKGLENVNQKLIEKVEEMGVKTDFRKVLGTLQSMIEWSRLQTGSIEPQVEKKEPERVIIKPGEVIR